ncbi:MAG TPA: lipocalin-like domain-containing protein [Geothrix sp.]|nr:lipocalin-like domain-containing protein [Geothrix sp.]
MVNPPSSLLKRCLLAVLCGAIAAFAQTPGAGASETASPQHVAEPFSMEGTWAMVGAYEIRADGTRSTNYGEHPKGLLMVDKAGRYSLQIFRPGRPRFIAGDKVRGTAEEFREAVLGSSTHTGQVLVDAPRGKLIFKIETASFPNWEGAQQVRDYSYKDGILTYQVPTAASGNGSTAYSIWRRLP